jgi:hypothetical protein
MGSTESKSVIDNEVTQDVEIKTDIGNTVKDSSFCSQMIEVEGCTIEGNLDLTNRCKQTKIVSATQKSNVGATTSNTLAQNLTSAAEAEGQNVNLNPGDTSAESLVKNYTNLTSKISTAVNNEINAVQSTSQLSKCKDTKVLGNATILNDSDLSSAADAVQNSKAVADAVQDMTQTLASTSKAVQKDAIGSLALLVLAYAVLAAVGVWGLSKLGTYFIYIGIILLIAGLVVGFVLLRPVYSSATKGTEPCFSPEKRCLSAGPGTDMLQNPCCVVPDGTGGVGVKEGPAACIRLKPDSDETVFRQALLKFNNVDYMYDIDNKITRLKPLDKSVAEQVTAKLVPLAEVPIPVEIPPDNSQIMTQGTAKAEIQRILKDSNKNAIGIIVKMLGDNDFSIDGTDISITGGGTDKWTLTTGENGAIQEIEIRDTPRKPDNGDGCYTFNEQATCPLGCEWSRPRMGVPRDYANSMCADNKSSLSKKHCAWVDEDSASGSLQNIPVQKGECVGKARTQAPDAPLGCSVFRAIGVGKR